MIIIFYLFFQLLFKFCHLLCLVIALWKSILWQEWYGQELSKVSKRSNSLFGHKNVTNKRQLLEGILGTGQSPRYWATGENSHGTSYLKTGWNRGCHLKWLVEAMIIRERTLD